MAWAKLTQIIQPNVYKFNLHFQCLSLCGILKLDGHKMLVLLGKAVPKCWSYLVNLSQTTPSEAEDEEGVGIGGLYGDTLIRSFRGSTSNHQPHIKLSSLPIASKIRVYQFFPIPFRRGRSAGLFPRPWSFSNGYFGSTAKVHRL